MIYELANPFDDDIMPQEHLIERMRLHRDRLLAGSDWTQLPDAPIDQAAWATYRQQLRDFPSTWAPGPTAEFPEPPT
jgi:hypothetical protein